MPCYSYKSCLYLRGSRKGMSCLSDGDLGGVVGFSMCGIPTYKQVKFLGKILQHCCGKFFFPQGIWEGST